MSETTGISWTDHTFNPWWGCVKVSPACDYCYAGGMKSEISYGDTVEWTRGAIGLTGRVVGIEPMWDRALPIARDCTLLLVDTRNGTFHEYEANLRVCE